MLKHKYITLLSVALLGLSSSAWACSSGNCNTLPDYFTQTSRAEANSHSTVNNTSPSQAENSTVNKGYAVALGSFAMAPLPAGLCDSTNPEYRRISIPFLVDLSEQKTNSLCPKIHMREYLIKTCQFADARQLDKAILNELVPNFQHDATQDQFYINLNPKECDQLNKPMEKPTTLQGVGLVPTPEAKESVAPDFKPVKKIIAPKKGC